LDIQQVFQVYGTLLTCFIEEGNLKSLYTGFVRTKAFLFSILNGDFFFLFAGLDVN